MPIYNIVWISLYKHYIIKTIIQLVPIILTPKGKVQ